MEQARVNDVDIAFEVTGDGEPVLLIHGAAIADAMRPIVERLEGFRVIRYHRRGYGESGGGPAPDVATHAADARALLEHLGATPAHIVGHSYGGATALQLASETPDVVHSLTLLEAAVPLTKLPSAPTLAEGMGVILAPLAEGDFDAAADRFLRTVLGRDYRAVVEKSLSPAALAQTFADADDCFAGDLTSLNTWTLSAEDLEAVRCPTLIVAGGASDDTSREAMAEFGFDAAGLDIQREMIELQRSWLPHAESVTLPGLNHALQMQDAAAVCDAIVPFLARHRAAAPA